MMVVVVVVNAASTCARGVFERRWVGSLVRGSFGSCFNRFENLLTDARLTVYHHNLVQYHQVYWSDCGRHTHVLCWYPVLFVRCNHLRSICEIRMISAFNSKSISHMISHLGWNDHSLCLYRDQRGEVLLMVFGTISMKPHRGWFWENLIFRENTSNTNRTSLLLPYSEGQYTGFNGGMPAEQS